MSTFFDTDAGTRVWLEVLYSPTDVAGVSILVAASTLSLIAVLIMLTTILITSFKTDHAFMRTHLGAYFISLILAELVQAVGSIMSARWLALRKVDLGTFCATQAGLKNAGNVSTALWSLIIAAHTFALVFLKARVPAWAFYTTLTATWSLVALIALLGPAALAHPDARGPFWGVAGHWCWITAGYGAERFGLEYFFMFLTAGTSVVLYTLIFLRMRGNITGVFRVGRAAVPWAGAAGFASADPQIERVGRSMLLYPLAYVILVLPIAACRWAEIYGHAVPFAATIFADTVFLLSGVVNAVLYSTTRRVAILPSSAARSRPGGSGREKATMESFESGSGSGGSFESGYGKSFESAGKEERFEPAGADEVEVEGEGEVEDGGMPGPRVDVAPLPVVVPYNPPVPVPVPVSPGMRARSRAASVRRGGGGGGGGEGGPYDRDWI